MYVRDIADPKLVEDVLSRMMEIKMDDIPETGYIEQLIEDSHISIFPQIQNTERPDRVIASVLEGKVSILLDGTPFALILPMTLTALMQSPEDYYQRWTSATLLRLLRYIAVLLTIFYPGFTLHLSLIIPVYYRQEWHSPSQAAGKMFLSLLLSKPFSCLLR